MKERNPGICPDLEIRKNFPEVRLLISANSQARVATLLFVA
jgi:hypothetical protein